MSDFEVKKKNSGFASINKWADSEKHPRWKGQVNVDGVQWDVAVWKSKNKHGDEMLSFQFQTLEEAQKWKNKDHDDEVVVTEDDLPFNDGGSPF